MKITQLMYINEITGLSCRGNECFLPYGEMLCLAGRPVPAARLWDKLQKDGYIEFPDKTGCMDGTCRLTQQSFTPRKAVYDLSRTDSAGMVKAATITV